MNDILKFGTLSLIAEHESHETDEYTIAKNKADTISYDTKVIKIQLKNERNICKLYFWFLSHVYQTKIKKKSNDL